MYQLKSTDADGQILLFPLHKPRTTVGRDPSNDIVLTDTDVSRWHALLIVDDGRLSIRDVGATNGLFVNNARIHERQSLEVGHLLIIGSNLFVVDRDQQRHDAFDQTVVLPSGEMTGDGTVRETRDEDDPSSPENAFGKTVVRNKFDLLENAFEKKKQVARFPRLVVSGADGLEQCYVLATPVFRIGRGAHNHLRLPDPTVSANHAELRVGPTENVLVDLGSNNGTRVDGKAIDRHVLRDGDVIDLPGARLVYRHGAGLGGRFSDLVGKLFRFW